MKYQIVSSRDGEKAVKRLGPTDFAAVSKVIDSLELDPWPASSVSEVGTPYLRIRVRRYRIIYEVDTKQNIVYVKRIARRNEKTYKGL
jgi:mRNA-degrading endonuclease RelE of RelBE toxin-antitoxin system